MDHSLSNPHNVASAVWAALFEPGAPVVIAEIGGNHGGDLALAKRMVDAVAAAGGRVAKFQTYVTRHWISETDSSFAAFEREALAPDDWVELAAHCQSRGVIFLSTPFDPGSADLLDEVGVPAFKIASGDLTNVLLLRHVAGKGKPVLLSTGAATWPEIDAAVRTVRDAGHAGPMLLHCTAAYPTPDEEANLRVIPELRRRYGLPVGFSDHTVGIDIALGAAALEVAVIEKHVTIDHALPGGDNAISILPDDLARLIDGVRRLHAALGSPRREVTRSEAPLRAVIRRSLTLRTARRGGDTLQADDLLALRPDTGISADEADRVIGRTVERPLDARHRLAWPDLL